MKNIWESPTSRFYYNQISSFGNTMAGTNYVPDFSIVQFILNDTNHVFTNISLEELFSYEPKIIINGTLIPTTLQEIKDQICYGLSFPGCSHEDYDTYITRPSRELIFWNIVNNALNQLTPDHYFLYKTKGCGIFGEPWLMWDICFILIKDNNGILVSCGAWD